MSVEYFPAEEMWEDILTKDFQGKSYRIIIIKIMNMPELYVEPGDNVPVKWSNTAAVYENKKKVKFNRDVRMKDIPKTIEVQTKSFKLTRHAKNPTSLTYFRKSVLAKLRFGERNRQT